MATVGRKNLKEQAVGPVPVEADDIKETVETGEKETVETGEKETVETGEKETVETEEKETVETEEKETVEAETVEEVKPKEDGEKKKVKVLRAITYILYNGRMYGPQEELPVDDAEMIEAWTDAGTAVWD